MSLQLTIGRPKVSKKLAGAFFAIFALFVQPLVALDIPDAFAVGLTVTPATQSVAGGETKVSTANAMNHENLNVSFGHVAEELEVGDSLSYGWRVSGGADNQLGVIEGATNSNNQPGVGENGQKSSPLPVAAAVSNLEIYFTNIGGNNDVVEIDNIAINGDAVAPATATITSPSANGQVTKNGDTFVATYNKPLTGTQTARYELLGASCGEPASLSRIATANSDGTLTLDSSQLSFFQDGARCVRLTVYNNAQSTNANDILARSAPVKFSFVDVATPPVEENAVCDNGCEYKTIAEAVAGESAGVTITVKANSPQALNSNITIDKQLTLQGENGAVLNVSGTSNIFTVTASGVVIKNFTFNKSDNQSQNIVNLQGAQASVINNTFSGQYTIAENAGTTRAFVVSTGANGFTFSGNTVNNLRQPGYINNLVTGTIANNYVNQTRGFVIVSDTDLAITGNSWGQNAGGNDIVFINQDNSVNNYPCERINQIKDQNNNAGVQNQKLTEQCAPADRTAPVVVVKPEMSTGSGSTFSSVSFKLSDDQNVKQYSINRTVTPVTPNKFSDANNIVIGQRGAVYGSNTITVTDVAGNTASLNFVLDNIAPKVVVKDDSQGSIADNTFRTVNFKLSDTYNVKGFSVNGGAFRTLTPAPFSDANGIAVGTNGGKLGDNVIVVTDIAGNTRTVSFTLDNVAPGGTVTFSNNNGNQVTNQDVLATLKTTESVRTPTGWTRVSDTEFTKVHTANGKFNVQIIDFAGNTATVNYEIKRIDRVSPVINGIENGATYTTSSVPFTITEQSIQDVVIDGVRFDERTAPRSVTGQGQHSIEVIDKAGNTSGILRFTIDSNGPIIVLQEPASANDVQSGQSTIKVKFSDEVSGLDDTILSVNINSENGDQLATSSWFGSFGLTSIDGGSVSYDAATGVYTIIYPSDEFPDGIYDIQAIAVDNAGNETDRAFDNVLVIDNNGPMVEIQRPEQGAIVSGNSSLRVDFSDPNGLSERNTFDVNFVPADGSAQTTTSYFTILNNGFANAPLDRATVRFNESNGRYVISYDSRQLKDGSYNIYTSGFDRLGNRTVKTFENAFVVDNKLPTGTFTYSNNNGNQVTNEDVTVTLKTSEAVATPAGWSKVSDTEFTKAYSENGKYSVTIADTAGNNVTLNFEVKRIDKIDPVINGIENGKVYNQDVTYTVTEQSIREIIVDGTTYSENAAPRTITAEGQHSVQVIDKAGNKSEVVSFIIDKTAPAVPADVAVVATPGGESIANGSETTATGVTVNWAGSEGASRYIYKIWTDIDGSNFNGEENAYTEPVNGTSRSGTFTEGFGSYFIQIASVDAAGNISVFSDAYKVTFVSGNGNGGENGGGDNGDDGEGEGGNPDPETPVVPTTPIITPTQPQDDDADSDDASSGSVTTNSQQISPLLAVQSPALVTGNGTQAQTGDNNGSVLGDSDATDDNGDVLGTRDNKSESNVAAITSSEDGWKIFGIAWYWWLLILAALAGAFYLIAGYRKRNSDVA